MNKQGMHPSQKRNTGFIVLICRDNMTGQGGTGAARVEWPNMKAWPGRCGRSRGKAPAEDTGALGE